MKLFDLFKNKKEDNSAAKEEYEKALKSYEKDSYQEALGILSWGFKKDSNYKPLYKLSANCLEKLGATEEAQLFINTIENFNKFESFNHLGTHFFTT